MESYIIDKTKFGSVWNKLKESGYSIELDSGIPGFGEAQGTREGGELDRRILINPNYTAGVRLYESGREVVLSSERPADIISLVEHEMGHAILYNYIAKNEIPAGSGYGREVLLMPSDVSVAKVLEEKLGKLIVPVEKQSKDGETVFETENMLFTHVKNLDIYKNKTDRYNEFYTEIIRLRVRGELGEFLDVRHKEGLIEADQIEYIEFVADNIIAKSIDL